MLQGRLYVVLCTRCGCMSKWTQSPGLCWGLKRKYVESSMYGHFGTGGLSAMTTLWICKDCGSWVGSGLVLVCHDTESGGGVWSSLCELTTNIFIIWAASFLIDLVYFRCQDDLPWTHTFQVRKWRWTQLQDDTHACGFPWRSGQVYNTWYAGATKWHDVWWFLRRCSEGAWLIVVQRWRLHFCAR